MGECSCARAAARGACSPWGADPRRGTPKGGWPLAAHTHRRRGPCVNTPFLTDSWLARSTGIEQWLLQSCHNKLDEGNDNFALCRALLEVCRMFGVFHILCKTFPPAVKARGSATQITSGGEILRRSKCMGGIHQAIMKMEKRFSQVLLFSSL